MKMQAGGQYALPEVQQQQFNVNRSSDASASHGHIFALGNEMSPSSSLPKSHSNHAQHLNNHLQQHQHQQPLSQSQHHPQPSFQVTHEQDHHQIHQQSNPLQELQKDQNRQGKYLQQQQQLGLLSDSAQAPAALATRPSSSSVKQMNPASGEHAADDDEGLEDGERVAGGNRWPRQETLALIKIRSEMDSSFRDCAVKGPLWEEVSRKLSEQGYGLRNGRKCKEKFENIYKYYKKTKEGRAGRQDGKNYRFFAELEALYGSDMNNGARAGGENGKGAEVGMGGSLFKLKEGTIDRVAEGGSSAQRPLEIITGYDVNLSSETSEEEYDEPGDMDYTDSRKRKRKLWGKRMVLFEKILKKFFKRQEELQRKFFDVLERREQDRFVREEAWKRQETARLNREYELRAQEHALAVTRNSALVAYMQRISGQKVQLPDAAPPLSTSDPMQTQEEQEKDQSDPNRRWPKTEVQALIRVRGNLEPKFQDAGPKGSLWEEVAAGMTRLGYNRNAKRCKEKWENINKYFRKSKDSSRKRSENAKTCQYFNQLDDLYRKGVLVSPSSKLIKSGDPTDELPEKAGVGSNEDTAQAARAECDEDILVIVPNADATNVDAVAEEEIPSDGANVKNLSVDPENGDPDGDREQSGGNDELSLAADANTGISAASLDLAFDSLNGNDMFPGINSKSHKLEGLDKGFLEMQNLSEFEDNTEQQEMMDQDTRQASDLEAGSEHTLPSTRDKNDIDSFTVT
ncbi:hypothetical protein O6H91_02G006600 [Diphasiastrum complanatum]|uniref:Uncharacterized protein n=1 Tax=Diphasiastrum complanatum TaxID=34168 RepID=A0ACC2ECQ0_DIPCM|nr:hypothetical protein O6H91_02G006600 [Diphasiastrum complanatum]